MVELYRLFRGPQNGLDAIPKKRGYIYFCEDTGNLYVDTLSDFTSSTDGEFVPGKRVQVNAGAAKYLINSEGEYIDVDNIITGDVAIGVAGGGTGRKELTDGGVLVGRGEEPIDSITGTGFLISDDTGLHFEEVLPIEMGGTGGTSLEEILVNLNIYNQEEIDNIVKEVQNEISTVEQQLQNSIDGKQDKITGTSNQLAGFDESGNLVAKSIDLVNSFKGRTGAVVPQVGDYTAAMVGARPNNWIPTAEEVGAATMTQVNQAIQQAVLDSWAASY